MQFAQKTHGSVMCRVRKGETEDWEVVETRNLRAAVEHIDRMFGIPVEDMAI